MKKRILALISIIMSFVIGLACMTGCNLVTTDMEKDMNQTVATVDINYSENILKKELVLRYINIGYLYVQYYGYTTEQTYELLIDSLIQNRIFVQYAMQSFEEDASFEKNENYSVNNAKRYLTDEEITDALYSTRKAINDMLDSYEKADDEEEVQDSLIGDTRTTPTDASNTDKEVTTEEKESYNEKAFDISSSAKRRNAFDKLIDLFENNGLLGDKYNGKIEETEYYTSTLKSSLESAIISKYEDRLTSSIRKTVTFEMLEELYEEKYNEQKAWNNTQFVEGLNNASAESPLLYSAYGNYGYVYNLLLGASEDQKEDIEQIKVDNPNISDSDYALARKAILDETIATDLRSSWILADYYGSLNESNKFVFDNESGYSFAKDSKNSLPFYGEVEQIKEKSEDEQALYTVKSVDKLGLDEFIAVVENYLNADSMTDNSTEYTSIGSAIYRAYKLGNIEEYDAKIQDLLFAFSTDSGSLNTYKGYDIAPAVDGSDSEEYVATFGEAGRKLLEQGQGYVIVASDYGYHILFFSSIIDASYDYNTLTAYLNAVTGENKDRDQWKAEYENSLNDYEEFAKTNSYLYLLANSLIETKVSNAISENRTNIINQYRYEETNHVTIYSDRYADLLD